jgi:hypothetical protein
MYAGAVVAAAKLSLLGIAVLQLQDSFHMMPAWLWLGWGFAENMCM